MQRGRDSNPRYVAVYTLSRRAPSTTRTPLYLFRGITLAFGKASRLKDCKNSFSGLATEYFLGIGGGYSGQISYGKVFYFGQFLYDVL